MRTAALAFERQGLLKDGQVYNTMVRRLSEDRSPVVRREIVGILARLGTDDAKRAISTLVGDEDAGVREAVSRAFGTADNSNEPGPDRPERK